MSKTLKPCPFCGRIPELPDGRGTQYEIECDCGMSRSCIQICNLMTPNERDSSLFDMKSLCYEQKFIDRARDAAIENWNTRMEQTA